MVSVKEGAVLFAVTAGIDGKLNQWVERIAPKIADTCARIGSDWSKVVPITVLNLRSPTSTAASEMLDRELTSLLLLRLARESNVLVLERRKLLDVALEKDLAAKTEQFLSGAYLLDGIVNKERFEADRVTVSARLVAPDKTVTAIEVAGARTNTTAIVEALIRGALASLQLGKSAAWDPAKEAQEHADEAAWALRWKMYPEAEAAGDAAWALGNRTRDVAMTRALAYVRDHAPNLRIRTYYAFGDFHTRRVPNRERIDDQRQSLAILDDLLGRDPGAIEDDRIYAAVCEALEYSGRLLWDFYEQVESRAPVQEELAEIRKFSRNIEVVTRKTPRVRRALWSPRELPGDLVQRRGDLWRSNNIARVDIRYAGLFNEAPEGALEIYRDLVSAEGYPFVRQLVLNRNEGPRDRIGGWKWSDRKRQAEVWDGFINELLASTNLAMHIEGRILEIENQTEWVRYKGKLHALVTDLDANWEKIKAMKIPMELDDIDRISYMRGNGDMPNGEYEALHNELKQWVVDRGITRMVSNGREILPRVKQTNAPPRRIFPKLPEPTPVVSTDILKVTDFWSAMEIGNDPPLRQVRGAIYREGKLWFLLTGSMTARKTEGAEIFGVDLVTKATRIIPLDLEKLGRDTNQVRFPFSHQYMSVTDYEHLPKAFEVRSNEVFVAEGAMLNRFDLLTEKWSAQSIPEARPDIYLVNGQLYLSGMESIYELGAAGAARTLASARRRPALTILDELDELNFATLTLGPGGTVRSLAQGNAYLWDGSRWNKETDLGNLSAIGFDNGAFLATVGFPPVVQLHAFRGDQKGSRYVAAAIVPSNEAKVIGGHTNETLVLYNDILHGAPFFAGERPALFLQYSLENSKDGSRASLLIFGEGNKAIAEVPMQFQGANATRLSEAMSQGIRRPWVLDTPEGVVIGHALLPGFWFVPREQMDASVRKALRLASSPTQTSFLKRP
jgi:hypothetical protein